MTLSGGGEGRCLGKTPHNNRLYRPSLFTKGQKRGGPVPLRLPTIQFIDYIILHRFSYMSIDTQGSVRVIMPYPLHD